MHKHVIPDLITSVWLSGSLLPSSEVIANSSNSQKSSFVSLFFLFSFLFSLSFFPSSFPSFFSEGAQSPGLAEQVCYHGVTTSHQGSTRASHWSLQKDVPPCRHPDLGSFRDQCSPTCMLLLPQESLSSSLDPLLPIPALRRPFWKFWILHG